MSILLRELIADVDYWDLTLLGTDVDAAVLARARRAHYKSWSLRVTEPAERGRYFILDRHGHYVLRKRYRQNVEFALHNLADANAEIPEPGGFDLILCRNVAIVVGSAANGESTVAQVGKLRPDLITMDACMPRMDGVTATRRIMGTRPTPIAIVTANPVGEGSETTFRAMAAGAVDVIAKPTSEVFESDGEARRLFVQQLRNVAQVGVVGIRGSVEFEGDARSDRPRSTHPTNLKYARIIAIGASTGGPPCVRKVLSEIDAEQCPPVVVTQHMSAQFLLGFSQWLDSCIHLPVTLARHDAPLEPGHVYIAPGDHHLETTDTGRMVLSAAAPVAFHRPSVDVMFHSIAQSHGPQAVAVLLTGMGKDGARGMKELFELGALTIAQDEESSLVYGMPAAAAELNAARLSANPSHIGRLLRRVRLGAPETAATERPAADIHTTKMARKGNT